MIKDSLKEATSTAEGTEDCDEKVEAYQDAVDNINAMSEEVEAKFYAPASTTEDE